MNWRARYKIVGELNYKAVMRAMDMMAEWPTRLDRARVDGTGTEAGLMVQLNADNYAEARKIAMEMTPEGWTFHEVNPAFMDTMR